MAKQEIIDYCKETPGNTNVSVLSGLLNTEVTQSLSQWVSRNLNCINTRVLERWCNQGGGGGDWTTIRLEPKLFTQEGDEFYILASDNPEDIAKWNEIVQLYKNNQPVITELNYKIESNDWDGTITGTTNTCGCGFLQEIQSIVVMFVDIQETAIICDLSETVPFITEHTVGVVANASEDSYCEIKYKTDTAYTINIAIEGFGNITGYIEEGGSRIMGPMIYAKEEKGEVFTSNLRCSCDDIYYYAGDELAPNSNMNLIYGPVYPEKIYLRPTLVNDNYVLCNSNANDIEKFLSLLEDDDPIIYGIYEYEFTGASYKNDFGIGSVFVNQSNKAIIFDGMAPVHYIGDEGTPVLTTDMPCGQDDSFIINYYTEDLPYYTIHFFSNVEGIDPSDALIKSGNSWMVPDIDAGGRSIVYSDGTTTYSANDVITPTSDITLEIIISQ